MSVRIREIMPAEAGVLSAMSDSVGWNNAPAECRLLTETAGMSAVFLEVDGVIAGSAGMVVYEPRELVFINLVIVKPEFRRRGYATLLIEHILARYQGCRTFKLHATPEGSSVYAPLGFRPRRSISFYTCTAPTFPFAVADGAVHRMDKTELEAAIARDGRCFGYERRKLLEFNYREHPELALAAAGGRGYLLGRRWKKFRHLSCLAADDPETALNLVKTSAELDAGQPLSIIAYDLQQDFQQRLRDAGFAKTREMLDMEWGEPGPLPAADYRAIYGGDMG